MFFGEPFGGILPGARGAVLSALLRTGTPMTGRQIHGLLADEHSLWAVQEALKVLGRLGLVHSQEAGRAKLHTINDQHVAVVHLRALADPIGLLTSVIAEAIDSEVDAVIVFGSVARGQTQTDSDIDLAVIAAHEWSGRADLEDAIYTGSGNTCDVLVLTPTEFGRLAMAGEPVVADIMREGIPLIGSMPSLEAA